jgi:biopolymer transport protein ExbD
MATRRTRRFDDDAGVDMTPMLDIVFILLIFFIVTATFLDERGMDFTQANSDAPIGEMAPTISIQIAANGEIAVQGRVVPLSLVEAEVQRNLIERPGAAIDLRADARAPLAPVVAIKDDMERVGRAVRFETYEAQAALN